MIDLAKRKQRRDRVYLIAYGANGNILDKEELSLLDYYDDEHALIDDDEYRAQLGVRKLTGEIYDSSGERTQYFENEYDEQGHYLRGRIEHSDDTVAED